MASSFRNLIVHAESKHKVVLYSIDTKQIQNYKEPNFARNTNNLFDFLQSTLNLNHVKAIVFNVIGFELSSFVEYYEFRLKCREFCQKLQIFCLFPTATLTQASIAISQTKTMVKEGETVMIFLLDFPGMPPTEFAFVRKTNSYHYTSNSESAYSPFTKRWKHDIFKVAKPAKLIFVQGLGTHDLEKAQKFFKDYNPILYDIRNLSANFMGQVIDKVFHEMGEKIDPYDVALTCLGRFEVRIGEKSMIKATEKDIAPFEKSVIIDVNPKDIVTMYGTFPMNKPPELIKQIKLSTYKSKKVKVTLKLDINSFYEFKVEPFDGQKEVLKNAAVERVPEENVDNSSADKLVEPDKARMVFDKQNFTVSYFVGEKEYNLNDSDGLKKTPIYISFQEKKPIIGKAAVEIYNQNPGCVVFDLIKLCSVSTNDIINPKWGFYLSKESESLFVIMETFDDEKKSTVEFLLAIILKEGKDRIKKETGKRMKEIEIKFDGFSPNEILKKNFIEAGKLLKINILFV